MGLSPDSLEKHPVCRLAMSSRLHCVVRCSAPLTLVEDGRKHLLFENIVSAIKGDEPAQPTPLLGGMANDMLVRVIVGKEDTVVSPIIGTLLRQAHDLHAWLSDSRARKWPPNRRLHLSPPMCCRDALASRGVDAGLVTIEGGDHRLSEPSDLAAMWSAVQEILDARHVIS